jgi:hypothetical protein
MANHHRRRLVAPAAELMICGDATIEDEGNADPGVRGARETRMIGTTAIDLACYSNHAPQQPGD